MVAFVLGVLEVAHLLVSIEKDERDERKEQRGQIEKEGSGRETMEIAEKDEIFLSLETKRSK